MNETVQQLLFAPTTWSCWHYSSIHWTL